MVLDLGSAIGVSPSRGIFDCAFSLGGSYSDGGSTKSRHVRKACIAPQGMFPAKAKSSSWRRTVENTLCCHKREQITATGTSQVFEWTDEAEENGQSP